MKIDDLFYLTKGDTGLTDEYIYQSLSSNKPLIPIYGGNSTHDISSRWVKSDCMTKAGKPISLFSGKGIILSLDGSAGSMTYKDGETFALNHHACFLKPRGGSDKLCDPQYFAVFFQNQLRALSVSNGSKTLSKAQLNEFEFSLPNIEQQARLIRLYQEFIGKLSSAKKKSDAISALLGKHISSDYVSYQAKSVPIAKCIDCASGNTGLTEELIYQHSSEKGRRYKVLSASTSSDTALGYIPMCDLITPAGKQKALKTFCGKEGLLVIRKGSAGVTKYLPEGDYAINDDAYILSRKKGCSYEINLQWLAIAHRHDFLAYASSADNATWNKTGFFSDIKVDIPDIKEQRRLVAAVSLAEDYSRQLSEIQRRLNDLLNKEINIPDTVNF